MQLFPTKYFKIELNESSDKSIEKLKLMTLESDSLSTQSTNKEFIGRIKGTHFEIISSEVGIGAFTVLQGDFSDDSVAVIAKVNTPFKVLISILFTFGIGGFVYNATKLGFPAGLGMLVPLVMFLGLLRFVFLGLLFKRSLRLVYVKFTSLLKIEGAILF